MLRGRMAGSSYPMLEDIAWSGLLKAYLGLRANPEGLPAGCPLHRKCSELQARPWPCPGASSWCWNGLDTTTTPSVTVLGPAWALTLQPQGPITLLLLRTSRLLATMLRRWTSTSASPAPARMVPAAMS